MRQSHDVNCEGLLELQELCWQSTPAPLLERVVAYERVHAMPGARA